MLFVDLDPASAAHLYEALRAHRARVGSGRLPDALHELETCAGAWAAQNGTQRGDGDGAPEPGDTDRMDPELLTYGQTAELLNVSERKARQLVADGALTSVRLGRNRRVPRQAVADYIDRLTEEAS